MRSSNFFSGGAASAVLIVVLAVLPLLGGCSPHAANAAPGAERMELDDPEAAIERLFAATEIRSRALEEWVLAPHTPEQIEPGSWRVENLQAVGGGRADGYALYYRAEQSLFVSPAERPSVVLDLVDQEGRTEPISFLIRPGEHHAVIRPDVWGITATGLQVHSEFAGFEFLAIAPVLPPESALQAIPIEMSELLYYPQEEWRREEFELFSWSLYPEVLWIDSRDYEIQAAMFKRMAHFVEKRGVIGTLLTDEELALRHGWNGHNYRGEGLAAFYNAVEAESFPINEFERAVREIVSAGGIIYRDENGLWTAGAGGLLAISQESYPELRRLLLSHEAMHGVFYEEPAFREAVATYWDDVLSEREREYWRGFFSWMSYSPADEYLMINEFQAYLLQQDESAVSWYFRMRIADRLRTSRSLGAEVVNAFLTDYPRTFVLAAEAMNEALFRIAGLVGGDPFCFRPIGTEG